MPLSFLRRQAVEHKVQFYVELSAHKKDTDPVDAS